MLGNSGCSIKFDYDNNVVIKSANGYPVSRLYKQYTKSKYFRPIHDYIKYPIIKEWTATGSFKMEMIDGYSIIDLARNKTLEELSIYADMLYEFIQKELEMCDQYVTVNDQLIDKLESIEHYLVPEDFNIIIELIKKEKIQLPIGRCHGDLTFANMIFKGDNIYFLDFLDSFIDSPVLDIVKLQQDTIYKWSTFLPYIKYKKINDLFDYLNSLLNKFSKEEWYNNQVLHIVNLARILPYSQKNERILGYLYSCIQQTLSYCQCVENQKDFLVLDLNGY